MGYKILGFAVWHGALWYVRRRVQNVMPSRRMASAAAVAVAVVTHRRVAAARRGDVAVCSGGPRASMPATPPGHHNRTRAAPQRAGSAPAPSAPAPILDRS